MENSINIGTEFRSTVDDNCHLIFFFQVYIDSPIILNGVCLRWKGYINLEKLDGVGGMKFDEDSAHVCPTSRS